jgi:hypothetical protein
LFLFSNLQKNKDELYLLVNEDLVENSIGSTKINLKKYVFGKVRYEDWVKQVFSSYLNGIVHVIIENHVKYYLIF